MLKLGPAVVMTPDLGEALKFYGDVLGLPLVLREVDQLIFDLGKARLHVFRCERPARVAEHGADASSVICFEVTSIEGAMRDLKRRGVTFIHESPNRNVAAGLSYAAFDAPGGNVHELVELG